jgi:hypothetical protein
MESALPTVVLVHGAWTGPWARDEVRRYLDLAGIASAAVSLPVLPGCGRRRDHQTASALGPRRPRTALTEPAKAAASAGVNPPCVILSSRAI